MDNLTFAPDTTNLSETSGGGDLYQFPSYAVVVLSVFYGGISAVSIVGNVVVIVAIILDRRLQTVTNFFIGNLSLADILIGVFSIPFQFQAALLQTWNLPHFLCPVAPFFKEMTVNVSIFTLTVISFDRYMAVLHPIGAKSQRVQTAVIKMSVVWGLSTLLAVPSAIAYRVNTDIPGWPQCLPAFSSIGVQKAYHVVLVLTQYFLPFIVIMARQTRDP